MRQYFKTLFFSISALFLVTTSTNVSHASATATTCEGKFPNPISDYCWSCVFPIKIAGAKVPGLLPGSSASSQEDNGTSPGAFCTCGEGLDLTIGMTTSFWEPITLVDVVRKPFCLAGLGGVDMGQVIDAPPAGFNKVDGGTASKDAFYQVHWYVNPVMYWLSVVVDHSCLEVAPFDVAYLTELDPLWNDDELSTILNPDVYAFANPLAQAACAADCVTASTGFSNRTTYWCAGCQGAMLPVTGKVTNHIGMVDSTSLLLQKFAHKAHRELLVWSGTKRGSGDEGLCYKYPKYIMDKSDYKYSMVFPVAQDKNNGRCCQPFGRTTAVWGAGKAFPYKGEDAVYQIFRKRDCCVGKNITGVAN